MVSQEGVRRHDPKLRTIRLGVQSHLGMSLMRHYCFSLLPCAFIYAKELWDSLAAVGIKKDVKPWIGMDRRQFARQLDGDERFDFSATMQKFPVTVMQEFAWRLVLNVGLPERVRGSLPLLLAYESADRPMLKMQLPEAEKVEKRA